MTALRDEQIVSKLRSCIRGSVLDPSHGDFEGASKIWNGMMDDRVPALLVRCAGIGDVRTAVRFAREHGVYPAVRGGGHSAAGLGTSHGGLVIDLSTMRQVRVIPDSRIAIAQGGATWGDYDHETQAFGLASPGGVVSTTGVAGLTLGGGIGWLNRKLGLACDSLVAAELVTSDGDVKFVTNETDPELMWALKGGGGNFGIATALHFTLHTVGPYVLGGALLYSMEHAEEIIALVNEFSANAPDELGIGLVVCPVKPVDAFPSELHWRPVVAVVLCWSGELSLGENVIAPFRRRVPPLLDLVGKVSYVDLQKSFDATVPKGRRSYWKSGYLRTLGAEVADKFIEHGANPKSALSQVEAVVLGGAFARVDADMSCFGDRTGSAIYNVECFWEDPRQDTINVEWARQVFSEIERFSTGTAYVNFLSEEGESRVRDSYSANYDRLARIKARMDPDNLFRINQNIQPASRSV
jgi:FAD binding domain/Berberine and berberine like